VPIFGAAAAGNLAEAKASQLVNGGIGGSDHFLGSALAAAWTQEGTAPAASGVGQSVYSFNQQTGIGFLSKAFAPAGALDVVMRVGLQSVSLNCGIGLLIKDSAAGSTGNGMLIHFGANNVQILYSVDAGVLTQRGGSPQLANAVITASEASTPGFVYLRLTRDGANAWNGYFSYDRQYWRQVGAVGWAKTFVVANMSIRAYATDANDQMVSVDFIDVVNG
jgi:hypothetical protein